MITLSCPRADNGVEGLLSSSTNHEVGQAVSHEVCDERWEGVVVEDAGGCEVVGDWFAEDESLAMVLMYG